jgi:predicted nucleic acid-binding protein
MNYLIDTNIIIDYLREYRPTIETVDYLFSQPSVEIYVSAISNLELHLGESITKTQIQDKIQDIFSSCHVLDITAEIAGMAGDFKRKGKADIVDSLIAATCLIKDLTLITRNLKDFKGIPSLKLQPVQFLKIKDSLQ